MYNFLIVPGKGILPDMPGLRKASEDYRRRFYGAAQFQLVMDADLPQADRDAIFTTPDAAVRGRHSDAHAGPAAPRRVTRRISRRPNA